MYLFFSKGLQAWLILQGNYFYGHLVLQYGTFGATGFAQKTGVLVWANDTTVTQLTGSLNLPVGLKQADEHTWYVTSMGDGTVLKVCY